MAVFLNDLNATATSAMGFHSGSFPLPNTMPDFSFLGDLNAHRTQKWDMLFPCPAYCTPWNKIGGYARARESECYLVHSLMVEMIEHSQAKIKVPMLLSSHERIHIGDKYCFQNKFNGILSLLWIFKNWLHCNCSCFFSQFPRNYINSSWKKLADTIIRKGNPFRNSFFNVPGNWLMVV